MSHADRPVILLLTASYEVSVRVQRALGAEFTILRESTVEQAWGAALSSRPIALLLEAEDARGRCTAPLVERARARNAALPVVAIVRRANGWSASTLELLGMRPTGVMVAEEIDLGCVLRALSARLHVAELIDGVWPTLEPDVPEGLRPLVRFALARSDAPLSVDGAALALGLHRKTLWMHCRRHGVESVQGLVMWCRLIAAAYALRTRDRSVDAIAEELEFASPTALRNAIRRYLNTTATGLRVSGGEAVACRAFVSWLREAGERGQERERVPRGVVATRRVAPGVVGERRPRWGVEERAVMICNAA